MNENYIKLKELLLFFYNTTLKGDTYGGHCVRNIKERILTLYSINLDAIDCYYYHSEFKKFNSYINQTFYKSLCDIEIEKFKMIFLLEGISVSHFIDFLNHNEISYSVKHHKNIKNEIYDYIEIIIGPLTIKFDTKDTYIKSKNVYYKNKRVFDIVFPNYFSILKLESKELDVIDFLNHCNDVYNANKKLDMLYYEVTRKKTIKF